VTQDESPLSFSAALPLWAKVLIGVVLGAIALLSVRQAVRRKSTLPRWRDPQDYTARAVRQPALIAAALLVALLALALDAANDGWVAGTVDPAVHNWFVDHRVAGLTPVVVVVTNIVSPFGTTVTAIVLATVLAWKTRSWVPAIVVFAAPSLAGLAVRFVKLVAPRTRPPTLDMVVLTVEPSFPSGHVAGAGALYGAVLVVVFAGFLGPVTARVRVLVAVGAALLLLVVALTRLYLAVHWFSDVAAGVLLAAVTTFATLAAYRQFVRKRPVVG
jgi:membrane-associated phospholipid phosphatase